MYFDIEGIEQNWAEPKGGDPFMKKWTKRISLLLAVIMLVTAITPTTAQAAKSPITKITRQPIRNGIHFWDVNGNIVTTPFWGNYYLCTTVTFAKSPKKTKLSLSYSHQVTPSKSGVVKLKVGKKTITVCKLKSAPKEPSHAVAHVYLDSVEIKTGKKWKKIAITNDGVMENEIHSEMQPLTLKKIPKGTKMRMIWNVRIWVPRHCIVAD